MDAGRWGRRMLVAAAVVVAAGALVVALVALGIGRLPGDVSLRRGGLRLYVPLASSLVISVVLTVLWNLVSRRRRGT